MFVFVNMLLVECRQSSNLTLSNRTEQLLKTLVLLSIRILLSKSAGKLRQNIAIFAFLTLIRVIVIFCWLAIWPYEARINFSIKIQGKLLLHYYLQRLPLTVLSSSPSSVNVIRVLHLTPFLFWLNYLAFQWTPKLIPCDFNKLRGEGESPSEGGQWLLFSIASLMNVSEISVQPGAGSAIRY